MYLKLRQFELLLVGIQQQCNISDWVQKNTGQFLRVLHVYSIDNFVAF